MRTFTALLLALASLLTPMFVSAQTAPDSTTLPPLAAPALAPAAFTFIIGDRVQTTSKVNVRSAPSLSGAIAGMQKSGKLGAVTGGPVTASGYTWWQINFDTGADGWVVETYLATSLALAPGASVAAATMDSQTIAGFQTEIASLLAQVQALQARLEAAVGGVGE